MTTATSAAATGQLLGYACVSTAGQHLEAQQDALTAAGVDPGRVYVDKLSGTSTKEQRPGLTALLDYARPGDTIVVTGVDRLGRTAAEVMLTIKDLLAKDIIIRTLREGVESSTATGRMVMGIMASLAELELGRERRAAAKASRKARNLPIGRPRKLPANKIDLAERMRAAGEPVPVIAEHLGISRPTLYRLLAERANR
jgi:DNA invertase Pin-like site-specific DNA recombinase